MNYLTKKGLRSFILLFIVFLNSSVYSQSPFFKSIKFDKSLKQFETYAIYQDSKGYIWFATSQGLFRHDGEETHKFGISDSLAPSPVTSITEDRDSNIWVGHRNGDIQQFNEQYFTNFSPEEGLSKNEITFLFFDKANVLWFGTLGEGVYFFTGKNRKRLYNLNTDDGLTDDYAYTAVQCPLGDLYVGTDNGIAVIDTSTCKVKKVISMKNGLPDNIVKDLKIIGNSLWICMDEGGIAIFDVTSQQFTQLIPWKFGRVNNFALRSDKECWVSTKSEGVIKFVIDSDKNVNFKQFNTLHGFKSNKTNTIFADRERNIWIGEVSSIVKSSASPFEFLDEREGFAYSNLFAFINDNTGRYWAATDKGLVRFTKNQMGKFDSKIFVPKSKESKTAFISLYQDSKGDIWAGTYGFGVYRINPNSFEHKVFTSENGLSDNNIIHITGKDSVIWLSTLGGGACSFNAESNAIKIYSTNEGLSSNYLYSTFIDSKNRIWIAQDGGGISLIDGNSVTTNFIPDSLNIRTVYGFAEDKDGNIWFTSAEQGFTCYANGEFILFDESTDFDIDNVKSICSDNDGNIIIVSDEAIQIFLPEVQSFKKFADEHGVSNLDPNLNAISRDALGNIWIATMKSIVLYTPSFNNNNNVLPKVLIQNKLLFFNPILDDKNNFSFRENHISFEFAGLWFQSPENILYRYKLQNYDYGWSRPTHMRSVTYSNLPPGNYQFILEVSHEPGIWTSSPQATYSFKIRPPIHKTWWFISISLIIIGSSIYLAIKARFAKLKRDKEILEKEVVKRTATIQQQKEEIESQRDYVIKQHDYISKQNQNITSSIQYASRIQTAIFPPIEGMQKILGDCFILSRPMEIVSGDFYWVAEKDDEIILAVADCTGHGVPGAFMSVLGTSLLNKIVMNSTCCKPETLLNLLRDEIKVALRQTGKLDEAKDGMDMSLVQFNKTNLILNFAGANNPVVIIRKDKIITLPCDRMPIGIHPKEKPFSSETIQLEKGDMLYLFSDGYSDQFGGSDYRKFFLKRFKELLLSIAPLSCDEQRVTLDKTMDDWKSGNHQNDDILVVGIRF